QEAPGALADEPKESFLSRHRRPILLAAAVVAIALLTLNLINQRLSQPGNAMIDAPEQPTEPADQVSDAEAVPSALTNESFANVAAPVSGPRVIPIVDSLATASIDPAASKGFTPATEVPVMPAAFAPLTVPEATSGQSKPASLDAIETASLP